MRRIESIFCQGFDKNQSGRISLAELGETSFIICLWPRIENFFTFLIQGDMLTNLGKIIPSEVSLLYQRPKKAFDPLLQSDLGDLMEEIDTDKNGAIDFSEFLNFMTTERHSRKISDASEYSEIFDILDVDKNGFISAEDIKKVRIIFRREAVVFLFIHSFSF